MTEKKIIDPLMNVAEKCYRFCVKSSQSYYTHGKKTRKVAAQVISVGNITWGGTGKTPLVIMMAKVISARGKRVVVLTRGYGQDELFELKNSLNGVPILVGRDRIKSAEAAVQKHHAEIILLDDGFQHIRLHRDCDVVAINATNPFGNGSLIPKGSLREPLENLKRASVFVITKAALGKRNVNLIRQRLQQIHPEAPIFEAEHQPIRFMDLKTSRSLRLDVVRNKRIAILSGIEDPHSFECTLNRLGAKVVYAARFDDHHQFTRQEIQAVFKGYREADANFLITTSKDYYRLSRVLESVDARDIKLLVLHIGIRIEDHMTFIRRCATI